MFRELFFLSFFSSREPDDDGGSASLRAGFRTRPTAPTERKKNEAPMPECHAAKRCAALGMVWAAGQGHLVGEGAWLRLSSALWAMQPVDGNRAILPLPSPPSSRQAESACVGLGWTDQPAQPLRAATADRVGDGSQSWAAAGADSERAASRQTKPDGGPSKSQSQSHSQPPKPCRSHPSLALSRTRCAVRW